MIKPSTVALSLLCCSLAANAQEQTIAPELSNALLWKVTGKNLTAPSYLYGTIHLICEEDFMEVDGLQTAFDQTNQLVLEMDITDMSAGIGILLKGRMEDKKTLKDLVTAEEYANVKTYFSEMGIPLSMFHSMQPLMLVSFLGLGDEDGCVQTSYELNFIERTKAAGEEVKSLESIAEVMETLKNIPYKKQAQLLLETINGEEVEDIKELVNLYLAQDITGLENYLRANDNQMAEFGEFLVDQRNINWLDNMETYMAQKPSFIAVGAGHLPGTKGLINLLRKQGYTVTAVSAN